jgi:hypothetical protein
MAVATGAPITSTGVPLTQAGGRKERKTKTMKKMQGGKKTRKGTPWTKFVKKIYSEMKKKNPDAKLGAAMKEASKRKDEM